MNDVFAIQLRTLLLAAAQFMTEPLPPLPANSTAQQASTRIYALSECCSWSGYQLQNIPSNWHT